MIGNLCKFSFTCDLANACTELFEKSAIPEAYLINNNLFRSFVEADPSGNFWCLKSCSAKEGCLASNYNSAVDFYRVLESSTKYF